MKGLNVCCVAVALAILNVSGCASSPVQNSSAPLVSSAPAVNTATMGTESCFWIGNVRHWDVIDPSTLIVYAPMPQEAFLVKLLQPIPDLRFHLTLGFQDTDHMGRICRVAGFVSVGGPFPWRSPVAAVRALSPAEVKQLKASGKAKGNVVAPPAATAPAAAG
jgi:Family of unknown function (DUF6491)